MTGRPLRVIARLTGSTDFCVLTAQAFRYREQRVGDVVTTCEGDGTRQLSDGTLLPPVEAMESACRLYMRRIHGLVRCCRIDGISGSEECGLDTDSK